MLSVVVTPRDPLGEHLLRESVGGRFSCLLDLAAAYAAVDYTDPT